MKIPYRNKLFNDERKWKHQNEFDDIRQVGIKKAIGYISYPQSNVCPGLIYLEDEFNDKLTAIVYCDCIAYLWVGDKYMIQNIINENSKIVINSGWPLDAYEFFVRLTKENICHDNNKKLYHVVCDMFNSWCLFCEEPVWFVDGQLLNNPLSTHPHDPDKT